MPQLPDKSTLAAYQRYVSKLEEESGFAEQTVRDKCLLLGEEIGELYKAIRKAERLKIYFQSDFSEILHELIDITIYIYFYNSKSARNRFRGSFSRKRGD